MRGTMASPSLMAKGPLGMKSFWRSMTMRASVGWRMMGMSSLLVVAKPMFC